MVKNSVRLVPFVAIALVTITGIASPAAAQFRPVALEERGGSGACCLPEFTCQVLQQQVCMNQGGTYVGNESDCSLCPAGTGACCADGLCLEATDLECAEKLQGFYYGNGTSCGGGTHRGISCPGACCVGGVCMLTTQDTCIELDGGAYQGDLTTCQETRCELLVPVDVLPRTCPNRIARILSYPSQTLNIAIAGVDGVDVSSINPSSIMLLRSDYSGGGPVTPSSTPMLGDSATPHFSTGKEDPCDCISDGPDGVDDLIVEFLVNDVMTILNMNNVPNGSEFRLELHGLLMDGTPFVGGDCVEVVRPRIRNARSR